MLRPGGQPPPRPPPQNAPPSIIGNAACWSTHMGVSANLRYQIINGLDMVGGGGGVPERECQRDREKEGKRGGEREETGLAGLCYRGLGRLVQQAVQAEAVGGAICICSSPAPMSSRRKSCSSQLTPTHSPCAHAPPQPPPAPAHTPRLLQLLQPVMPSALFRLYSFLLRSANNVLGGVSFVMAARILGVQKATEPAAAPAAPEAAPAGKGKKAKKQ